MNTVITISREFGSGGRELGARLAGELNYPFYDKEVVTAIVHNTDLAASFVKDVMRGNARKYYPINIGQSLNIDVDYQIRQMQKIVNAQVEVIKDMASRSNCVIVGRCADYILKELHDEGKLRLIRMFVYADPESRLQRCRQRAPEGENLTDKQLEKEIKKINKSRASYYEDYTLQKWGDKANYDICLNTSFINVETIVPHLAKMFPDFS